VTCASQVKRCCAFPMKKPPERDTQDETYCNIIDVLYLKLQTISICNNANVVQGGKITNGIVKKL